MGHYWDSKVDYRVDFIVPSQLIVIFVQGGHREGVGHPRREAARAAVREHKESGWEGLDALPSRLAGSSPSEAATRVLSRPYFACGGALGAPAGALGASGAPPAVGAPAAGASKGSPHCGHFSALTSSHT